MGPSDFFVATIIFGHVGQVMRARAQLLAQKRRLRKILIVFF